MGVIVTSGVAGRGPVAVTPLRPRADKCQTESPIPPLPTDPVPKEIFPWREHALLPLRGGLPPRESRVWGWRQPRRLGINSIPRIAEGAVALLTPGEGMFQY
ncbi:MAG: hypothetical protein FD153_1585 [Rhodospirillaceae bacterium]|nr:MAG: hypothetical protein FD153_1585 [Rhodospirillaceae bacterium]